jgi:hypothetical protein
MGNVNIDEKSSATKYWSYIYIVNTDNQWIHQRDHSFVGNVF